MNRLKHFIKTTMLGGLIVVLPVVLTFFFLRWLFNLATGMIEPITRQVMEQSRIQKYVADSLVIIVIILVCFVIGLVVKTAFGRFIYQTVEKRILKIAPGYSLFKETIKQFLGKDRSAFSRVALVRVFENSTMMTGFVTDEHPDGWYTVYVPSGLNPTTGLIYHLEKQYVHLVDVSVEDTLRSIISCGGGSRTLLDAHLAKTGKNLK
jgi:uncharacterized membrane protein